jgi:MEDS: MEthanogen/methylotroph, DcmR Sensory domain
MATLGMTGIVTPRRQGPAQVIMFGESGGGNSVRFRRPRWGMTPDMSVRGRMAHAVFFHDNPVQYLEGVVRWVHEGLAAGEPVLVAAGAADNEVIAGALGPATDGIQFADMAVLGANPARVIGAIRDFVNSAGGRRVRALGAPMWPGRSPAQRREVIAHEALVNLAFADCAASFLCPYDASTLSPGIVAQARRVHPQLWTTGGQTDCPQYDLDGLLVGRHPLTNPDPYGEPLAVVSDLRGLARLRVRLCELAEDVGLSARRRDEFVVAVSEVVSNALAHSPYPAVVSRGRDWDVASLVVEVGTAGCISDPLVGRELPADPAGGRGLWIVNQLCDLVETRSGSWGTLTRLHVHLP